MADRFLESADGTVNSWLQVCATGVASRSKDGWRSDLGARDTGSIVARPAWRRPVGQSHTDDSPEAVEVRMAALLQDMASLDAGLEPESTLHGILDAIMRVSGACYGAAGLCAPDGTPATFLQAGALAQAVPDSPDRDMLGFLRNRTGPLRIDGLARSAAEVGLPELLPPMRAVLGVPLVSHGEVLGSLYVADSRAGFEFSDAHVGVVEVLATVAADVVHSVWHLAKVRTVARWVSASREITMALLGMSGGEDAPLRLIVGRAAELTVASQAAILVPSEADRAPEEVRSLTVAVAAGARADEVEGQQVPVSGSTSGRVFRTGESTMTDGFRYPITSFTDQGRRPAIVVPLRSATNNLGVIAVARDADDPPFDVDEMAIMEDFAHHAAVALTLCRANEQARQLTVLSDRERIARDLHDHVIQRLFLAGMDLQGTIARTKSDLLKERLSRTVDDLQSIIDEIRTAIFDLQSPAASAMSFRQRIQAAVAAVTDNSPLATTVRISGPIVAVDPALADDAEAVIVEAISNAVRHSGATSVTISIEVSDRLDIEVVDNGRGIPANTARCSGLANLKARAQQAGGSCQITSSAGSGTHVRWSAPLSGA
ncbi:histidine kinase [Mycolicibacterium smegmatis]|uniref:Two component sensor histidine kinase Devs n=3 Tax=Mycolicibacterium smegmatis TaxID=1772 RepID=I7FNM4_MYCS2|nr:two component sensor histidine kinase Devs [Mycolicibacterium smegmatis MC2 155]AIU09055.1 histidine kinase [Mycolicibacterium smegmatis MC2 155]AIU15680.1 histidine kinase [Mycolicibacterium smegmatis]AIU22303.1 histidine kinase [Mycolicibacterium smegmatis]